MRKYGINYNLCNGIEEQTNAHNDIIHYIEGATISGICMAKAEIGI